MIFYATTKFSILIERDDTNFNDMIIEESLEDRAYTASEINFFVAFTIREVGAPPIKNINQYLKLSASDFESHTAKVEKSSPTDFQELELK